ncbi:MAG: ABC transporter permease subunit [Acidobacteriota bacterium]|nr:ABC transporter permease subunit [Acidobacteriota bacterium]MDE3031869.1 ABC transporter permease subunit [Acidobacteriota bacterium]MDE3092709.1 ABC transporter permease subunit [Acidobacteriota bacterium]MDE3140032.1 ABC transporter permease subunit [Acidobacteriota bacterium]MDE3147008.1 ABC transporter permease subunit [Acidobacteriota bacterium]
MASVSGPLGGLAFEEAIPDILGEAPTPRRRRRLRFRPWRVIIMTLAGAYFLLPIYGGLKFSLEDLNGRFSFEAIQNLPSAPGFSDAFWLSMRLALATLVVSTLLMVPTTIYVHLRLPRMRRVMEFVTILPIVIPPIVIIAGVLPAAPLWAKSSPYLLSFLYVILVMPFIYRSLDAGLSAIDLKTLVEASRSLGGNWLRTMTSVILPNLRSALLSAMVLTLALVLGEFTMASLDLWTTIPVWITQFNTSSNGHIQVAASMLGLVGTWVFLTIIVSIDRSESRRSRRKAGTL